MYNEKRLSNHKSAQCKVRTYDDGRIEFISYSTVVIIATPITEGLFKNHYNLCCTGTYSQTTRKQINWFLKEYFPEFCYYDMKHSYEKAVDYVSKKTI